MGLYFFVDFYYGVQVVVWWCVYGGEGFGFFVFGQVFCWWCQQYQYQGVVGDCGDDGGQVMGCGGVELVGKIVQVLQLVVVLVIVVEYCVEIQLCCQGWNYCYCYQYGDQD